MDYSSQHQATENSVFYDRSNKLNSMTYNTDKFIFDLKENFNKHKYRKCLRDMKEKENLISEAKDKLQISKIKMQCLFKIIKKKYLKYSDNPLTIKRIEPWLFRVNTEIKKWIDYMSQGDTLEESDYLHSLQTLILSVLEHLYYCYLFFKKDKKISEATAFLAFGEKLIKHAVYFTDDPDVIFLSIKILLSISSIHISDHNYEIAKVYAANSLKLCNLALKLHFNSDYEEIMINSLSDYKLSILEKVGVDFSTAFYQIGVCEENLGNLIKAIESYKQSKWFAINFFTDSMYDLSQFFNNVEKRAIEYDKLLKEIKSTQPFPVKPNDSGKAKKSLLEFYKDENKYQDTLKFLDNLDMQEFDLPNSLKKSEYSQKLLSTVYLINNLMSEKFRDITQNISSQHISNLPQETKEKIQKRLNEINSEKIYLEKENFRKKSRETVKPNTMALHSSKDKDEDTIEVNMIQKKLSASNFLNYKYLSTETNLITKSDNEITGDKVDQSNRRLFTDTNDKPSVSFLFNTVTRASPTYRTNMGGNLFTEGKNTIEIGKNRPSTSFNSKSTVKKYEHSKVIFEKQFQKTYNYLDKYIDRELNFQKNLLRLKSSENTKTEVNRFNPRESKTQFQSFYQGVIKNQKRKVIKNDSSDIKKKSIINSDQTKDDIKKRNLLAVALKSLNLKAYDEYCEFNKKKSPQIVLKKETVKQINLNNVVQKNNETNKRILRNLENLDKYENSITKNNFRSENLKKNIQKESRIMDHFIRK